MTNSKNSNNNLLLLMAMGGGSVDMSTILMAGDMLPATMRTVFAIDAAKKRETKADTLAQELARALQDSGASGVKLKQSVIDTLPELKELLDRLSVTERETIIDSSTT